MIRWYALAIALAANACGSVSPERGHGDVGRLISERGGPQTRWEKGTPDEAAIMKWVDQLLRGGLTRQKAVEIAMVNNPGLQTTYENLGVSQADMVQAGLLSNPTFAASVGFTTSGRLSEVSLSLAQNILDLLILPLRKEIAREQFMTDVIRVAHSALDVAAEVNKAFSSIEASVALIELRKAIVASAGAAADLSRRQQEAGNISDLQAHTQQAEFEQAKLDLAHEELELLELREQLTRLLGLWGTRTAWTIATTLAQPDEFEPPLQDLENIAVARRLDVDAARNEARLMSKAVDLASSSRWLGRIEVGIDGHQDPDGPRVIGPSLVIDLPLFDRRQVVIARLQSERRASERRLQALSINARSEVRLAGVRLTTARRVVDHYRKTVVPLRESIVQETQLFFNGMFTGLYQLLEAKKSEAEAKQGYLEAVRDYWMARADLERAAGGGLFATAATLPVNTPSVNEHQGHEGHETKKN